MVYLYTFQDDEYVIYSASQQYMRYLVEFTVCGDDIHHVAPLQQRAMDIQSTDDDDDVQRVGKYSDQHRGS